MSYVQKQKRIQELESQIKCLEVEVACLRDQFKTVEKARIEQRVVDKMKSTIEMKTWIKEVTVTVVQILVIIPIEVTTSQSNVCTKGISMHGMVSHTVNI